MWLPETAVNDDVLAVLAEEGVGFTILAPGQVAAIRPLAGRTSRSLAAVPNRAWTPIDGDHPIDTRVAYRFVHPGRRASGSTSSCTTAGCPTTWPSSRVTSEALVDRVADAGGRRGGLVAIALDGETFGHHHKWADRALAYALAAEAPRRGVEVTNLAAVAGAQPAAVRGRRCTRAPGRAPTASAGGRPTAAAPPAGRPAPTSGGGRRCGRRSTGCATPASRCSSGGARRCSPAATPGPPATPTSTCCIGAVDREDVRRPLGGTRRRPGRGLHAARGPAQRHAHVHVVRLVLLRPGRPRDRAGPPLRRPGLRPAGRGGRAVARAGAAGRACGRPTASTRATAGASGAPRSPRPGSTPPGWPPTWPWPTSSTCPNRPTAVSAASTSRRSTPVGPPTPRPSTPAGSRRAHGTPPSGPRPARPGDRPARHRRAGGVRLAAGPARPPADGPPSRAGGRGAPARRPRGGRCRPGRRLAGGRRGAREARDRTSRPAAPTTSS